MPELDKLGAKDKAAVLTAQIVSALPSTVQNANLLSKDNGSSYGGNLAQLYESVYAAVLPTVDGGSSVKR
jgi:hypothetical protein